MNSLVYNSGILITVKGGRTRHILQIISRAFYSGFEQKFRPDTFTTASEARETLSIPTSDQYNFWVDSIHPTSPYVDDNGVPKALTDDKLEFFDQPGTSPERSVLKYEDKADRSFILAYAFCIVDGGLACIVKWKVKGAPKASDAYTAEVVSTDAYNEIIERGQKALAKTKYDKKSLPLQWIK
jgi:hypothetical protein